LLRNDVALFVDDEHDGNLPCAASGEQTNGISGGAVFKHRSLGRTETCGVKGDGICTAALVEVRNRLIVPGTVSEDFQRLTGGICCGMPILHFLLNVFLNQMAVAAIPGHEVENDDASTVVVEVEPTRLVDEIRFDIAAIQRLKHDVGDGRWFRIGLEQLVHAVEHGEGCERNCTEHHDGDGEGLPRILLLEDAPIGLVKQAHTVN